MELSDLFRLLFDFLRFAVVPALGWLWFVDRRGQSNQARLSSLEEKVGQIDLVQLQVTLADIQKDIHYMREDVSKIHDEQQRQKDFLNRN